jgi:hypothetical protein
MVKTFSFNTQPATKERRIQGSKYQLSDGRLYMLFLSCKASRRHQVVQQFVIGLPRDIIARKYLQEVCFAGEFLVVC